MRFLSTFLCVAALSTATWLLTRNAPFFDFKQYVSAIQLFHQGANPYDPYAMLVNQKNLLGDASLNQAVMFWSPAWALFFIVPAWFQAPLVTLQSVWLVMNIAIIAACLMTLLSMLLPPAQTLKEHLKNTLIAALSAPVISICSYGQSSALLVVGATVLVCAAKKQQYFLAGFGSSLFLYKPHLVALFFLAVLTEACFKSSFRKIIFGAMCGTFILFYIQEVVFPNSTALWINSLLHSFDSSPYTTPKGAWLCSNLSGFARSALNINTAHFAVIIPIVTAILLVWAIIRLGKHITILREGLFVIPITLLCAPYGWFYDQGILIPFQCLFVAHVLQARRQLGLLYLLGAWNIGTVLIYIFVATSQHHLWWYPLGLLFLSMWFFRKGRVLNQQTVAGPQSLE